MKISTRLSITFSVISSSIFIIFGITIYFFSSYYMKSNFHERLKGRVEITEKIFLEKDSFSSLEFKKINDQFLHTLPRETEEVVEIKPNIKPTFKYDYSKVVMEKLISNDTVKFETFDVQGMSKLFNVKGKKYLIIVTAVNEVGIKYLSYLRNIIAFLILIGVPFIFIISFIIIRKALLPISKKMDEANTISASNLHQRLNVYNPNDEIGKMAISLNKLLDRLEISFESQKSFISNASHELKNPLTAIIGEAEIAMSKSRSNNEYLESLEVILIEADILNSTVNNLLQLSKITSNESNLKFEEIKFKDLLDKIKESYDFLNPNNKIVIDSSLFQINTSILGNKDLLKNAIINLFDNACKFSSNNKVDILLKENNNQLNLIIKDNGIGIPEKDIQKITDPFYRGSNVIKINGSGIGLSLSSKIIKIHKGTIEIKSKLGYGTQIEINIPLA